MVSDLRPSSVRVYGCRPAADCAPALLFPLLHFRLATCCIGNPHRFRDHNAKLGQEIGVRFFQSGVFRLRLHQRYQFGEGVVKNARIPEGLRRWGLRFAGLAGRQRG